MTKSIYYIECTCIRDIEFPNTEFHAGDILYYCNNASSNEMYLYNHLLNTNCSIEFENANRYKALCNKSHLPFTRQKKNARKYKKLSQAEWVKLLIDSKDDFKCEIKEIKITYSEEEI